MTLTQHTTLSQVDLYQCNAMQWVRVFVRIQDFINLVGISLPIRLTSILVTRTPDHHMTNMIQYIITLVSILYMSSIFQPLMLSRCPCTLAPTNLPDLAVLLSGIVSCRLLIFQSVRTEKPKIVPDSLFLSLFAVLQFCHYVTTITIITCKNS